jgi:Ca2+-transporting ATPase
MSDEDTGDANTGDASTRDTNIRDANTCDTANAGDGTRNAVRAQARPWHAWSVLKTLKALDAPAAGLTSAEAARRLVAYGPNELKPPAPASVLSILVDQLTSVVVLLLAVAAVISWVMGDRVESAAIAGVLVINTAIGFVIDLRARRAMEALLGYQVPHAAVIRDGQAVTVEARTLVPGDLVEIAAGQMVPADARVVVSHDVRTMEAALTGESLPVSKRAEAELEEDTALAERVTMIYKGTTVAAGAGRAVVTETGAATEIGRIGVLVSSIADEKTPLERRLDALGQRLVWLALGVAALVAGLGALQGAPIALVIELGIALAVAAVPEGLPAVATIALAIGLRRMAKRHALVRRLPAVESLGSATVVCTDKTRTLTSGDMTIVRVWTAGMETALDAIATGASGAGGAGGAGDVTGASEAAGAAIASAAAAATRVTSVAAATQATGAASVAGATRTVPVAAARDERSTDPRARVRRAMEVALLASRVPRVEAAGAIGAAGSVGVPPDPVDTAVAAAAARTGVEAGVFARAHAPDGLIPFSSERKLMAAFYQNGRADAFTVCVKGAPRRIVELCSRAWTDDGGEQELDAAGRERLLSVNATFASRGLRVLAVATGPVHDATEDALHDLTFAGFLGIMDPPAPGVKDTIARLRAAGLRTIMLTGDQRLTGEAIGRELGLMTDGLLAIEGRELRALSADALAQTIERTAVFSRVTPEDKLTIVRTLQQRGEIVAMLGDGVNDAAALRKADVGVAMGIRGAEVAKEAAAIVLQDDRFETIAAAVEEGRVVFDNIRKFVFYLFTCNLAEILVLLVAALAGMPIPLLPLQLLWLNMVTDTFPALALAIEPGDPDVMRRPPRDPREAMLSREFLRRVTAYAALIAGATLAALWWAVTYAPDRATTMVFMTLAFAQIFHLGNARSSAPVLTLRAATANPAAIAAAALSVLLQLAALLITPLADVLRLVPLGWREWTVILVASLLPAVVGQVSKTWQARGRVTKPDGGPLSSKGGRTA